MIEYQEKRVKVILLAYFFEKTIINLFNQITSLKEALPQAKPPHITLLEMDNVNVITVLSGRVYVWH